MVLQSAYSSTSHSTKTLTHRWSHESHCDTETWASYFSMNYMPMLTGFEVEDFPRGFPRLACFLDSDDSFMVYKRFGIVFSRLLLNKQDEIRLLEARLLAMDRTDDVPNGGSKYLMSRDRRDQRNLPEGWSETRPQLLAALETKLLEYCKHSMICIRPAAMADCVLQLNCFLKLTRRKVSKSRPSVIIAACFATWRKTAASFMKKNHPGSTRRKTWCRSVQAESTPGSTVLWSAC